MQMLINWGIDHVLELEQLKNTLWPLLELGVLLMAFSHAWDIAMYVEPEDDTDGRE